MIRVMDPFKKVAIHLLFLTCGFLVIRYVFWLFDRTCEEEMAARIVPIEIKGMVLDSRYSHIYESRVIELMNGQVMSFCECGSSLCLVTEPGDSIFKKANSLVFTIARGDSVFEVDIACPK